MPANRTARSACVLALAAGPLLAQIDEDFLIVPSDAAASDIVGYGLSAHGAFAITGAPHHDPGGVDVGGAAWIFERTSVTWVERAKLVSPDLDAGDRFGWSVAMGVDRAVVGALEDDEAGPESGAAYVYDRSGGVWSLTQKLMPGGATGTDWFGYSVALDGDTILVGAPESDLVATDAGAVYVFELRPTGWKQIAVLTASDADSFDELGYAVALDGGRAIVGARGEDGAGSSIGAAYAFERTPPGTGPWVETQKLAPSDGNGSEFFGNSVSLDGDRAVIGAYRDDDAGFDSGSAYVFERHGSAWVEDAKLVAFDGDVGDYYGQAVAVEGDLIVVGSYFDDDAKTGSGSGYVYTRGPAGWEFRHKLVSRSPDKNAWLGIDAALAGGIAFLGCHGDITSGGNTGSVHVFEHVPHTLTSSKIAISVSNGGAQPYELDAGAELAGLPYLLVGTASGSYPGTALDGLGFPLNPDTYTLWTLNSPNTPPLAGSFGVLGAAGEASASFSLPAQSSPSLVGLILHHAAAVFEVSPSSASVVHASNALLLALVP